LVDQSLFCTQCGNPIRHHDRFCSACGFRQEAPEYAGTANDPAIEMQRLASEPPPPPRTHFHPAATDGATKAVPPVPASDLTNLRIFEFHTGKAIAERLSELLQTARSCQTPDKLAECIGEALSILRFYELDALPPHLPYPVKRESKSKGEVDSSGKSTGETWVEGSPNPVKLVVIRAQALQYAASWNVIENKGDAMKSLQEELATECDVRMDRWIAERLNISHNTISLWLVFYGFWFWIIAGIVNAFFINKRDEDTGIAFVVGACIAIALTIILVLWYRAVEHAKYPNWKLARMKRWDNWLRSQGQNP
jgi:hypothetical protein